MGDSFAIQVVARGYEIDSNGHVSATVLLQYAQHARWECWRAAGVDQGELGAKAIEPVSLEERIRFHHELRAGEAVDVSCKFVWGAGKTFRVEQKLRKPDGAVVAEVTNVGGLLDLKRRKLIHEPREVLRSIAQSPRLLGLD